MSFLYSFIILGLSITQASGENHTTVCCQGVALILAHTSNACCGEAVPIRCHTPGLHVDIQWGHSCLPACCHRVTCGLDPWGHSCHALHCNQQTTEVSQQDLMFTQATLFPLLLLLSDLSLCADQPGLSPTVNSTALLLPTCCLLLHIELMLVCRPLRATPLGYSWWHSGGR